MKFFATALPVLLLAAAGTSAATATGGNEVGRRVEGTGAGVERGREAGKILEDGVIHEKRKNPFDRAGQAIGEALFGKKDDKKDDKKEERKKKEEEEKKKKEEEEKKKKEEEEKKKKEEEEKKKKEEEEKKKKEEEEKKKKEEEEKKKDDDGKGSRAADLLKELGKQGVKHGSDKDGSGGKKSGAASGRVLTPAGMVTMLAGLTVLAAVLG